MTTCNACDFGPAAHTHNGVGPYCRGPRHRREVESPIARLTSFVSGRGAIEGNTKVMNLSITRNRVFVALLAALALVLGFGLVNTHAPQATAAASTIRYTYAGDSITAVGNSWSWTKYLGDSNLVSDGGLAISGRTSTQILNDDNLVAHPNADVAVIALGTNDVRFNTSTTTLKQNIRAIADKINAPRVLIVALPPSNVTDYDTSQGTINRAVQNYVQNRSLEEYSVRQGWNFVNPWVFRAQQDGTWANGASQTDGVHPAVATVENYAGPSIANSIRISVNGSTK